MARDRQRAKQRKARRAGQNPGPTRSEPHRSNVPGELEHASGEADEFDAALVAGADGRTEDDEGHVTEDDELTQDALEADPTATGEIYADELTDEDELDETGETDQDADLDDEALAREAVAAAPARRGRHGVAESESTHHPATHKRSPPARFIAFLKASWAELQRVQWPDRRQVAQATAVVLGFVVVAGLYLGVADRVAQELVDLIL